MVFQRKTSRHHFLLLYLQLHASTLVFAFMEDTLCNECTHRVDKNKGTLLLSVFFTKSYSLFFIDNRRQLRANRFPTDRLLLTEAYSSSHAGQLDGSAVSQKDQSVQSHLHTWQPFTSTRVGLWRQERLKKTLADKRTCKVHTKPRTFVL